MRRFGPWLGMLALAAIAGVGVAYRAALDRQQRESPAPPKALEQGLTAKATEWAWSQTVGGKTLVEVRAKDFRQIREPAVTELKGVELKIFDPDGKHFDRVTSASAEFSVADGKLYSDGEVEITLGEAVEGQAQGRLLGIRTSGVTFENKTGKADTDRRATFSLDVGEGEGTGATYDPQSKELRLKKDVKLTWRGRNPKSPPMLIEAGELIYKEAEHKVWLLAWSKFARGGLKMDAGPAEVTIEEGAIRLVSTVEAKGVQTQPERTVEFAADQLQMILREGGLMEKITGQTNAKLRTVAKTGRTETASDRLDLSFVDREGEAVLKQAVANGRAEVKSIPAGVPAPDTRVLKADAVELRMRDGGDEIETVDTHSPGTIEFLPNRPGPRYRKLDGERMNIRYGKNNRIEYFRAVKAATRTDPDPKAKGAAPQLTWSNDLEAYFDAASGDLSKIEQWGDFRYRQGERQARAERASMIEPSKVMTLTGGARVWDAAGSTEADRIAMNQATDDVEATGRVKTVREPSRASADRMITKERNAKIRYEGRATVWQGQNRLDGETIDIDRTAGTVAARGKVVNLLQDRAQPVATVVRSQSMRYLDRDRVAFYEGDVHLTRPKLDVRSKKLRAYLSPEENAETNATLPDSGLDKAFAEGDVVIVQTDGARTRTGTGSEADYSVGDGKVVLMGGNPKLVETIPGAKPNVTGGIRLTWFGNSDKLLVEGAERQPASSTLRRKKPASPSDR